MSLTSGTSSVGTEGNAAFVAGSSSLSSCGSLVLSLGDGSTMEAAVPTLLAVAPRLAAGGVVNQPRARCHLWHSSSTRPRSSCIMPLSLACHACLLYCIVLLETSSAEKTCDKALVSFLCHKSDSTQQLCLRVEEKCAIEKISCLIAKAMHL
jgi:hypothetical protein